MSHEGRLALLEERLHALVSRSLIEDCVRQYVCKNEVFLVNDIMARNCAVEHSLHLNRETYRIYANPYSTSTTVKKCEINGDRATAESLRIGIYMRNKAKKGSVVALSLEDTLICKAGAWQMLCRVTKVQAALAGDISVLNAPGASWEDRN